MSQLNSWSNTTRYVKYLSQIGNAQLKLL